MARKAHAEAGAEIAYEPDPVVIRFAIPHALLTKDDDTPYGGRKLFLPDIEGRRSGDLDVALERYGQREVRVLGELIGPHVHGIDVVGRECSCSGMVELRSGVDEYLDNRLRCAACYVGPLSDA